VEISRETGRGLQTLPLELSKLVIFCTEPQYPKEILRIHTYSVLIDNYLLTCICLRSRLLSYDLGHHTSSAHHCTFRDVTPGLWGGGGRETMNFIIVGVDVACRQCTEC
jgi:hypothetical protein